MPVVLDACALIAFLRNEAGAEIVESYLLNAQTDCLIHALNLCEVYYDFLRADGSTSANEMYTAITVSKIKVIDRMDTAFLKQAGHYKAFLRKISLADCFALTLTQTVSGTLLTSDHHEFDTIAQSGEHHIQFIR